MATLRAGHTNSPQSGSRIITSMPKRLALLAIAALSLTAATLPARQLPIQPTAQQMGRFDDSLVIAPHYVDYLSATDERFAMQAAALRSRIGSASHILVGFAAALPIQFPAIDLNQPLSQNQMLNTLHDLDRIVARAVANHLIVHITLGSGFFHGMNDLRPAAIQQDVRNAQWFSDGWIAEPSSLTGRSIIPPGAWITPSRYAKLLRARMEEGVRIVGARLSRQMSEHPETLLTISGDGEVELNYERTIAGGERVIGGNQPIYADYSPFMVEEFRDWIERSRYEGDRSPSTDDNRDGHTFNRDFKTSFTNWRLRYFDSSGPIPFSTYQKLANKLPSSGAYFIAGGFDAPRVPRPGDPFWELWLTFRKQVIANYVRDFASWITTSPAPTANGTTLTVPPSRFYSHQIPADYLFGEKDGLRLKTSASPLETAFISPLGSAGITMFNAFDGVSHKKTGTAALFERLALSGANWGIFEYNPSMPVGTASGPSNDMSYYMGELRKLYAYRPHVIVPFAWTDLPFLKTLNIQNTPFEEALNRFITEVGNTPWSPRDATKR